MIADAAVTTIITISDENNGCNVCNDVDVGPPMAIDSARVPTSESLPGVSPTPGYYQVPSTFLDPAAN